MAKTRNVLTQSTPRDTLNASRHVLRMLQEVCSADDLTDETKLGMYWAFEWVCDGLTHVEKELAKRE